MKNVSKIIQNLPLLEEKIYEVDSLINEKKELLSSWGISSIEEKRAKEKIKSFQNKKSYLVRKYTTNYNLVSNL